MSDSEDESNLPSAQECDRRSKEFAALTNTDTALAMFYLQDRDWDLQRAVNAFFEENDFESAGSKSTGSSASTVMTPQSSTLPSMDPEPHRIRILSWNIDGLDMGNIRTRAKAVCENILRETPDVVFLQEFVTEMSDIFDKHCGPSYERFQAASDAYYTAMLLKKQTVKCTETKVVPFYTSRMGRALHSAQVEVKGIPMTLITSHLESTKEHAEERKRQLTAAFRAVTEAEGSRTVVFGGDLNLRDPELAAIGGLPDNIYDLWEVTGKRKEAAFTWDLTRNDNLEWQARFRPKCRFDRLYIRHSTPRTQLKPVYFELTGLERIPGCRRFPSDHWGILAHFDKV